MSKCDCNNGCCETLVKVPKMKIECIDCYGVGSVLQSGYWQFCEDCKGAGFVYCDTNCVKCKHVGDDFSCTLDTGAGK